MNAKQGARFTVAERKALAVLALLMVAIGVGLVRRAPVGAGQWLAVGVIGVISAAVALALFLLRARTANRSGCQTSNG